MTGHTRITGLGNQNGVFAARCECGHTFTYGDLDAVVRAHRLAVAAGVVCTCRPSVRPTSARARRRQRVSAILASF